jgi:16S rRNA U516 pseudouridylate synthase RsuA-like enzyme
MAAAVGNVVEELTRIRVGSLELGSLGEGESRRLSEDEVRALWEDSGAMELDR